MIDDRADDEIADKAQHYQQADEGRTKTVQKRPHCCSELQVSTVLANAVKILYDSSLYQTRGCGTGLSKWIWNADE